MSLTEVLELLGFLLIVAAAAVYVGGFILPAGLAVAGVGLIGVSFLIARGGRK